MKKLFILAFLSFGSLYFSQSVTERYNSTYNRYEYFDSNGNIIGHKKYNSVSKQWEYYDLKNSQPSTTPMTRQPYKYSDPQKLDISGLGNATTLLQNRLDSNQQLFRAELKNIRSKVESLNISESKKQYIMDEFNNVLSRNSDMITSNLSSANGLSTMIDMAYAIVNNIIKESN